VQSLPFAPPTAQQHQDRNSVEEEQQRAENLPFALPIAPRHHPWRTVPPTAARSRPGRRWPAATVRHSEPRYRPRRYAPPPWPPAVHRAPPTAARSHPGRRWPAAARPHSASRPTPRRRGPATWPTAAPPSEALYLRYG